MKRGRCPCECQITLDCWGRGLSSLHRSTPHFLLSSFCLSLFFLFSLCLTHPFFHFLIFFQPPLAHCSPLFFVSFSLSFSVISLQCTCSPSYLSSSVCFFFIHVPVLHSGSSISHHSFFSLPVLPLGSPSLYSQFVSISLYTPSLHSDSNVSLSSMYLLSILAPPSLIFLSSVYPFSILASL